MSPYRMLVLGLSGLLLLLQNSLSRAQNTSGGAAPLSAEDRKFLLDAAQSGLHEVKMGMLGVWPSCSIQPPMPMELECGLRREN
jgi:hypothetical protein